MCAENLAGCYGYPSLIYIGPPMTKAQARAWRLEWKNKRPRKLKKKLAKINRKHDGSNTHYSL